MYVVQYLVTCSDDQFAIIPKQLGSVCYFIAYNIMYYLHVMVRYPECQGYVDNDILYGTKI